MKDWTEFYEENDIKEQSLLRKGGGLFFANKVRQDGKKLEQQIKQLDSIITRVKSSETTEDKIDTLTDTIAVLGQAMVSMRNMIGNNTGVGVSIALLNKDYDKYFRQLLKGVRRR